MLYQLCSCSAGPPQTLKERVTESTHDNDLRKEAAQKILNEYRGSHLPSLSKPNSHNVLVTIVTKDRESELTRKHQYSPEYLSQTVAAYLQLSYPAINTTLLICDVSPQESVELKKIRMLNITNIIHSPYTKPANNSFETERRDYMFCLSASLHYNMSYYLLVEDDAWPQSDLLLHLHHIIKHRIPKIEAALGFIKLFHPTRLNGYITADFSRLSEWFSLSLLAEFLVFILFYKTNRASAYHQISVRMLRFVYFVLLFYAIGRHNVSQLRRLHPFLHKLVPAPSCCSPALFFHHVGATHFYDYMSTIYCKKGYAKDHAMDDFPKLTNQTAWFYEPKLFNHIGMYTTMRDTLVDPLYLD